MEEIISLIQTIGYPSAMTLLLFWYMTKQNGTLRTSVDNNTKILTQLYERIVKDERD